MPASDPPKRVRAHLREDETVLAWARPSPRSLAGPVLAFLAAIGLGLAALAVLGLERLEQAVPLATLAAILAAGTAQRAFERVRAVFFTAYTLTDHRLLASSSLLTRETTTVPLDQVSAIEQRRGLLAALLGLDTLVVSAYGVRGTSIAIPGLVDVDAMRSRLAKATVATASPRWLLRGD